MPATNSLHIDRVVEPAFPRSFGALKLLVAFGSSFAGIEATSKPTSAAPASTTTTNNMGTRGLFGIFYKGKYYMVYNQYDSYASGLGAVFLRQIAAMLHRVSLPDGTVVVELLPEWLERIQQVKFVSEEPPSATDIELLAPYTNLQVSEQSTSDWYCLTRKLQGDLAACLTVGYMMCSPSGTPQLDLFLEYAYVLNVDAGTFEYYFHGKQHAEQRVYPLHALPTYQELEEEQKIANAEVGEGESNANQA